ncbi:MAG TPA: hypothetical protein VIW78_14695, partial [Burkholderiales bacterium]
SLVITLTSAYLRGNVGSALPCLFRLELSRCVRFTNRFTDLLPDLRIAIVLAARKPVLDTALTLPRAPTAAEPDNIV